MANTSEIIQQQYNLNIYEITIVGKDGEVFNIYPPGSNLMYVSMQIVEGLFEASVVGKLTIRDLNSAAEQINFGAFDDLIIKMENPDIPNSYKSLRYKIYNVKTNEDQIKNNLLVQESNITNTRLDISFVSYEHYLLTYKEFKELSGSTGAGIITKIAASKTTSATNSSSATGLVNIINEQFYKTGKTNSDTTQKEMFIEPTYNWIWYKQNQSMYPWGKLNKPMKASQLMQFLAEHAVAESNPSACNFLFWQDLDRWNFRSIESLAKQPTEKTYYVSNIPTKTANIFSLYVVNESNYLRLFESNAFSAKYYLVEPKWEDPYREYLDYTESHNIKEITYDYFRDYDSWAKIEKYPLLDETIETKPTVANVVQDNISGYFSPTYSNREKKVKWEHYGYTYGNRDGFETWQPMFDQTDLDGEICRKIQKEIKEKIKEKKIEYAQKKNLKEKWKVYRCSICCDSGYTDPDTEPVFGPEYGVAAAGAITDIVNYDKGITLPGPNPNLPIGLTLSYDLEQEPFSKTIGEIMYLREYPDIQLKYLYDLEIKRVDLAQDVAKSKIQSAQQLLNRYEAIPVCANGGVCPPNPLDPFQVPIETCGSDSTDETGTFGRQCNSQASPCFCSQAIKNAYLLPYQKIVESTTAVANAQYYSSLKSLIEQEKNNFELLYEKYKNRKAFFLSKELGFTASNADRNLFNVKKVTRVPIRGSKYEKLAHKFVLPELLKGISGTSFSFYGFSAGSTSYYPYEIYYDDDAQISPKIKHPVYDSGYNFDIGYQARPFTSLLKETGGPAAGNGIYTGDVAANLLANVNFYVTWEYSIRTEKTEKIVYFNGNNTSACNCVFDQESCGGGGFGGQCPPPDPYNPCQNCCYSIQNWNSNQGPTFFVTTDTSSNPQDLNVNTIVKNIVTKEKTEAQAWLEDQKERGLIINYSISSTNNSYEYTYNWYGGLESCTNRSSLPKSEITFKRTYQVSTVFSKNGGNSYLNQFGEGICYLNPFGAERLDSFDPIDYLNSRNYIDIEPSDVDDIKKPIENVLSEIESYIRVDFEKPVGIEKNIRFPKGFYDTPGSEYYLPYQVIISAGPFGTKSVDYNVSVLGQDPYGFDVAVKRVRRKKQELKADKKALTNYKDYHILSSSAGLPNTDFANIGLQSSRIYSYGRGMYIESGYPSISISEDVSRKAIIEGSPSGFLSSENVIDSDQGLNTQQGIEIDYNQSAYTNALLTFKNAHYYSNSKIFGSNPASISNSDNLYHDYLYRYTRKNPLSLPNSYFNFKAIRLRGTNLGRQNSSYSPTVEGFWRPDVPLSIHPGNVFHYWSRQITPFPIDVNYFKSSVGYNPSIPTGIPTIAYFEFNLKNINERVEPEDEQTFFGTYYGSCIWKHPQLDGEGLSDEEVQKSVWLNDYSGESEYGIIGPELDEEDAIFDRNFAAQFVVIGRQGGMTGDPCSGYLCSNPEGYVSNSGCPDDNPVCNCPCQELRPDRINSGITGSEPTYEELVQLENEIKECSLIEDVLGEEWIGCMWNDPKNPLNCNCPCVGEKFLDYLRYSKTYCTFWNTPSERPLLRNAQLMQILANKLIISVNGDFTLRPGMKVKLDLGDKRYSGTWLVSEINHDIAKTKHLMTVTLIRDSEYLSPEKRAKELKLNTV